jgi:hypothetical protein
MANELGREALRRFREEQTRREQTAEEAPPAVPTGRKSRQAMPRLWLKANASPDEYAEFRKLARAANLTLANYVRMRLGLPVTRPGRPRRVGN